MTSIYHIHYKEANCPYPDDQLEHDIFFVGEEGEISASDLAHIEELTRIIKSILDFQDDDEDNLFPDYVPDSSIDIDELDDACEEGWHEKIEAAFDLAVKSLSKNGLKVRRLTEVKELAWQIN